MLRNEDHFELERFSLNLCKLSSLNVRITIRVAWSKYAQTSEWSDKSIRIMPLKTLCARLSMNMLSISVAEYEVRRVGWEMRGRKAYENQFSVYSCVGTR